ncbi:hypothetical protein ACFLR5_02355 [Elusimicrobiota bacterium]
MPELKTISTPYQQLSLTHYDGQYSILSNYRFSSSFPDSTDNKLKAAFFLSQKPAAKNILIIGSGSEELIRHISKYGEKTIY